MKQAVILAAGEGQRLRPFTVNRPKVMLSIAGRPILGYVVEALAKNGIRNIVMVVGYRKDQIFDYFGSGERFDVEITYVTQERQLGTAHALAQAQGVIADEFLLLLGDNLIEAETIAKFVGVAPEAVLVKKVDNPKRYGVVDIKDGEVQSITEKPEEAGTNIISTGIYAFSKEIFRFIEPELDVPAAVNKMIAQGETIKVALTDGVWLDAVYPWDILSLNDAVLRRVQPNLSGTMESNVAVKGRVAIGENTVLRSHSYIAGPAVIGEDCDIGPSVCIQPSSSIGNNVVINPFTVIRNSVIGDDVNIGPGCIIYNSVIDKGSIIKGQFTACSSLAEVKINGEHYTVDMGVMVGEGCRLGNNIVAQPGTIIGNYSQVQGKTISGRLSDRSLVY
jgi:glucose-1-phosphate thymidylyltransferase